MKPSVAAAKQALAAETTAQTQLVIKGQLDRIEAKLDQLIAMQAVDETVPPIVSGPVLGKALKKSKADE